MVRHLSFGSVGELAATLVKEAPSDVYCSNAYYRFPTNPMQSKEWLGADLIFDIDGKDLDLPCVPSHTYFLCSNCGLPVPAQNENRAFSCASCGAKKVEMTSIPCTKCLEGSKKEVRKLTQFLTEDLGIRREDMDVYFSGNNGFHVHIRDKSFVPLDSSARSELAGYLCGVGLMSESIGVRKGTAENLSFKKFPRGGIGYGWRKKAAEKLKIGETSVIRLKNIVDQKGGYSAFKVELDKTAREMGSRIDPQVTTDVHRVFRMPGTLNGKSGLTKARCKDLDDFDPFIDACMLGDNKVNVKVKIPVKLSLKRKSYSISKESAELPAHVAVYLACKNLAEIY
ncbi:MAG TPA: DNA primase small subunit domain-containing protein [Nitrososphaera sp.]|nr:DNA primase small subunit domain-containing protein [Nitrososphaera sp.]